MLSPWRILFLVGLFAAVFGPVMPCGNGQSLSDDPRLGSETGKLRYRISRGPAEEVEVPDVITLKNGKKLEAYFLNIYGDSFVFYVKETERSWLREVVSRSEIGAVDFHQYLDQDPVAPAKIEPATKQPALKDDFLSGTPGGSSRFRAKSTRSSTSRKMRRTTGRWSWKAPSASAWGATPVHMRFIGAGSTTCSRQAPSTIRNGCCFFPGCWRGKWTGTGPRRASSRPSSRTRPSCWIFRRSGTLSASGGPTWAPGPGPH